MLDVRWFKKHPYLSKMSAAGLRFIHMHANPVPTACQPPSMAKDNDLARCIPIELHGDDADAHRRRSFLITSFQSAVTKGSTMDTIFPIYCLENSQASEHTADLTACK